jgi:hypothetical protein
MIPPASPSSGGLAQLADRRFYIVTRLHGIVPEFNFKRELHGFPLLPLLRGRL